MDLAIVPYFLFGLALLWMILMANRGGDGGQGGGSIWLGGAGDDGGDGGGGD